MEDGFGKAEPASRRVPKEGQKRRRIHGREIIRGISEIETSEHVTVRRRPRIRAGNPLAPKRANTFATRDVRTMAVGGTRGVGRALGILDPFG